MNHVESVEPCDEYNSPYIRIIMRSSKNHIITFGSKEERDKAVEELWGELSGLGDS